MERWQNVYCALFHECWIKSTWDIHMTFRKYQIRMSSDITEKWSFSLRISSVNMTKSTVLEIQAWRIWSHLQKKFLMKNFIFRAVRNYSENKILKKNIHCVKSVQIRSYFWSVFSCIQSEYRKIRTRNNSLFGYFSRCVCRWGSQGYRIASNLQICVYELNKRI